MTVSKRLWVVMLLLSTPMSAGAWSAKEHIMLTRIAARELIADPETPPEMKQWLSPAIADVPDMTAEENYFMTRKVGKNPEGFTGVLKHSYQPDVHQMNDAGNSKVAPFNIHEKKLHFIDVELFVRGDAKRGYRDDLSGRPPIADFPRDLTDPRYQQAGMLPFRVEFCFNKLVECITAGRMHDTSQKLEGEDDSATRWAGYIAHYLEDNTQPHHATLDYKSQSYFGNARKAPNIHSEMEYRMVDDEIEQFPELRKAYWALLVAALGTVKDTVKTDDLFVATLEVSLKSYEALPLIGAAARSSLVKSDEKGADKVDTEKFFRFTGKVSGQEMTVMQMKAYQQAWAVQRVKRIWLQAWKTART